MNKSIFILLLGFISFRGFSQNDEWKKITAPEAFSWFNRVVLEDSTMLVVYQNEAQHFIRAKNKNKILELRLWNSGPLNPTFAITVTRTDTTPICQRFFYYMSSWDGIQPLDYDDFTVSRFFTPEYLASQKISPDEIMPDYLIQLPEKGEIINVTVQKEIFKPGDTSVYITRQLDPEKIQLSALQFTFNGSVSEIITPQHILDETIFISFNPEFDASCGYTNYFEMTGTDIWTYHGPANLHEDLKFIVHPQMAYDSIQILQRFYSAYAKKEKENDRFIFYDTTLDKRKDRVSLWYSTGPYSQVIARSEKNSYWVLPELYPVTPLPKPRIAPSVAETVINKNCRGGKEIIVTPYGSKTFEKKKIPMEKMQVYPYTYEILIKLYSNGKVTEKTLRFVIRHGGC